MRATTWQGQRLEYAQYVAEKRHALFRFATVLSGDSNVADDVVGQVLATAFERWQSVSAADNVHAYVRRMIVNEYLTLRRASARLTMHDDLDDIATPTADHAESVADHYQLVHEMRKLPPKQRAAVVLRFYEGLSYAEIASVLGSGENAIRSNISRALHKLRIHMSEPEEPARPARQPEEAQ